MIVISETQQKQTIFVNALILGNLATCYRQISLHTAKNGDFDPIPYGVKQSMSFLEKFAFIHFNKLYTVLPYSTKMAKKIVREFVKRIEVSHGLLYYIL